PGKHVLYLSKRIGPRGAGTEGEAAAASYIRRVFREQEINADSEGFSSWKSDLTVPVILFALCIGAYFLFLISYTLSFLLSGLVFLLFQMETYSWSTISKLLPKSGSSNIIGKIAPEKKPEKTVVFTANYDSSKNSPIGNRLFARFYNIFYTLAFISITLITIMGIAGLVGSLLKISRESIHLFWLLMGVFPAYLLIIMLMFLTGEIWGRYQAGANDNAAGVAVMICAMAKLAKEPLGEVEVWGVATGRGFAGGRGMVELLKRHKTELKDAYFINLDHPGKGDIKLLTREGPLIGFRCNNYLRRLAINSSRKLIHTRLGRGKCRVKKSDSMVALARNFKAVAIGGNSRGGTYYGYRSSKDTSDAITRSSLDQALNIAVALARAIDSDNKSGRKLKLDRPGRKRDFSTGGDGNTENKKDKEEELILQ
ncbi:MAG: M28 family peptidase, partial [Actinobacteria bacterium]|nr:M28 family peptidase [Actinomycetota bacterium]